MPCSSCGCLQEANNTCVFCDLTRGTVGPVALSARNPSNSAPTAAEKCAVCRQTYYGFQLEKVQGGKFSVCSSCRDVKQVCSKCRRSQDPWALVEDTRQPTGILCKNCR